MKTKYSHDFLGEMFGTFTNESIGYINRSSCPKFLIGHPPFGKLRVTDEHR